MDVSKVFIVVSMFLSTLHGLAWLLLLGAVYAGRQPEISQASTHGNKPFG